jgi:peptidoglycan DL-endopeptidase CwlO
VSLSKADPRSSTPVRFVRLAVAVSLVVPLMGLASAAQASPASDIRAVQKKVDTLQHQAEVASEEYNDTREELKGLEVRVKAAQTRLEQQRARVQESRRMVGRLAAESYRNGDLGTLELYLGDNPDALLAQSGVVETLADRQVSAIARLKESQRKLAADTADLGRQEAKVKAGQAKLATKKKEVERKLSEAKALLSRLTAAQRAALERASRDAARQALESAGGGGGSSDGGGAGGGLDCGSLGIDAPTAKVKKVLDFACAQLGKPYVWAADGPGSYDCSGLTMRAWAQGGVSLPHSSRMQAGYGSRVSRANLRPGDLVFFYSPISHVGIYVGNGLMLHAPHSGDVVKIAPLHANLTAATRL